MDGMLINKSYLMNWVDKFINSKEIEVDMHIDDIIGQSIHKKNWIDVALQLFNLVTLTRKQIHTFVLIRQKTKNRGIEVVNTSQLRGIVTPPSIILYKGSQESVLFDNSFYSVSISNQFNVPAYVHYDSDYECDVFIGGDQSQGQFI